jgi:hypothetical protein
MHGCFGGESALKKTMNRWKGTVVISHGHKEASRRETGESGVDWLGLATGAICEHPNWRSLTDWNRGFLAGSVEVGGSGRFQLDHMRLAGDAWTDLYTPWGIYAATCIRDGERERWVSRLVEENEQRYFPDQGG